MPGQPQATKSNATPVRDNEGVLTQEIVHLTTHYGLSSAWFSILHFSNRRSIAAENPLINLKKLGDGIVETIGEPLIVLLSTSY